MSYYIDWIKNAPLLSAAIQFAILGTLGEIVSLLIRGSSLKKMGNPFQVLFKVIAWGILGIIIKYGFTGMKGFTDTLMAKNYIPFFKHNTLGWAFFMSLFTNLFFGPTMMFFHRVEDNIIMQKWNFKGIEKAWFTLLWFWIPAHTITFSLQSEFQIGLAALWSIVLGIILGISSK